MIKEACVESFEKSLEAQNNGANRIELCENLAVWRNNSFLWNC